MATKQDAQAALAYVAQIYPRMSPTFQKHARRIRVYRSHGQYATRELFGDFTLAQIDANVSAIFANIPDAKKIVIAGACFSRK